MFDWLPVVLLAIGLGGPAKPAAELERMAAAVEGAESNHGADPAMWRPRPTGPQGPMQVSAAAAADVGGGDRFAPDENRAIGRAYLALMFKRYGNWADAVAAYNWGPANVDRWIAAGRPASGLSAALRAYIERVRAQFFTTATAPQALPTVQASPPVSPDPPPVEIRDPALRKIYLADRVALARLRDYLVAATPSGGDASEKVVLATIQTVATRPGYAEFARVHAASASAPPSQAAVREIAGVMIAKLQSECTAIVLVDQKRHPRGAP
jgi:hypothetical protein